MPDLTGATVIHVHPGHKLIFVMRHPVGDEDAVSMAAFVQRYLKDIEVAFVSDVSEVVMQSAEAPNGCAGEGLCDREVGQPDE